MPATRIISTTAPLTGGGDLTANRTLGVSAASTSAAGVVKLATSVSSTSTTEAATPSAVKATYDLASTVQAALNNFVQTPVADCNDAVTTGFYSVSTGANKPDGVTTYGNLLVITSLAYRVFQFFVGFAAAGIPVYYIRMKHDSTWYPWRKILDETTGAALSHAATHKTGGADALAAADIGAAPASHATQLATASAVGHAKPGTGLSVDAAGALAVAYGTGAGTACQGNDSRLSNTRTPTAHAATHKAGGGDDLGLANADGILLAPTLAVAGNAVSSAVSNAFYWAERVQTNIQGVLALKIPSRALGGGLNNRVVLDVTIHNGRSGGMGPCKIVLAGFGKSSMVWSSAGGAFVSDPSVIKSIRLTTLGSDYYVLFEAGAGAWDYPSLHVAAAGVHYSASFTPAYGDWSVQFFASPEPAWTSTVTPSLNGLAGAKPTASSGAVGEWRKIEGSSTLPSGGTWAYFAVGLLRNEGADILLTSPPTTYCGIAAGGSSVPGLNLSSGFAWRIA